MRRRVAFGLLVGGVLMGELAATPAPAPEYSAPRDAHGHDVYRYERYGAPRDAYHKHGPSDSEYLPPRDAHGYDVDRGAQAGEDER